MGVSIAQGGASSAEDTAQISLTIETWLEVNIQNDIGMTTVTPDWFGQERKSSGTTLVDVYTNTDAILRCLQTATLTNGGTYTVDAQIVLLGDSSAYYLGDYICIDFSPSAHPGKTSVTASIKKTWTFNDVAGTYSGTMILELLAK